MRDFVAAWTHGADWQTWIAHAAIALLIFAPLVPILGASAAAAVPIGYYTLRELEQLLYGYVDRTLDPDWVDHLLDVAAPAGAVLGILGILGILGVA